MHSLRFMVSLFILSLPLFVALALLVLISKTFRFLIGILLTLKTGKKIEFLSGTDSVFLLNWGKSKLQFSTSVVCQGELDFEAIRTCALNSLTSNHQNFSKFFKYPDHCCGYYYWKEEEHFDINEHLILHKCKPPSTIEELARIQSDIINWQLESAGKSPWKIVVFPLDRNYEEFADEQPGYIATICTHHAITDGYGLFYFMLDIFSQNKPVESSKNDVSTVRVILQTLKERMIGFFYAPTMLYDHATRRNTNILHRVPQMGERILHFSRTIALDRLRNIRKKTGTTITDIAISCIVGAIEKHFEHEDAPLPDEMHCNIPISVRKSASVGNNVSGLILKVPLGSSNPVNRLTAVHNEMNRLKTSPESLSSQFLQVFTSNQLPIYLTRAGMGPLNTTFIATNIPLGRELKVKKELGKFFYIIGFNPHGFDVGMGISVMGYNEQLKFHISSDKTVLGNYETLVRFLNDMIEEIRLLEESVAENIAVK